MVFAAREIHQFRKHEKCIFCHENTVDEFRLGKIYKYKNFIVHYFCLLFASHLQQNGTDKQGILGFLIRDIEKELRNKLHSICTYCRERGAASVCAGKSCKVKFHFPCGIKNLSFHVFCGQFESYCFAHRRIQVPRISASTISALPSICVICQSNIDPVPCLSNVWASCCGTTWLHKDCVQRLALSAGYFFKCPNCNNQDDFRKEMVLRGIYIPNQDAAWELEPNSFRDLTERYHSCDADVCFCEQGRKFFRLKGQWKIILCNTCGSQGVHNYCGQYLLNKKREWTCNICSPALSKFVPKEDLGISSNAKNILTPRQRSSRRSLPATGRVREDVSMSQRKRRCRNSLPNDLSTFHNRSRGAYNLRDLPKISLAEPRRIYVKQQSNDETYTSVKNNWKKKKEQGQGTIKRKIRGIRRVKCDIGGTEVRIPSTYKKLLKDFHIFISDISPVFPRQPAPQPPTERPKHFRRYSML